MSAVVPPTASDRLLAAFRTLVRNEAAARTFAAIYEYAITASDGTTVDAQPTDSTQPLPPITKLPLQSGLLGETVTPPVSGALCRVAFLNGDPSRPCVLGISGSPLSATVGTTASSIALGPSPVPLANGVVMSALLTALGIWVTAVGAWLAAFTGALGSANFAAFAAAMIGPTGTLTTATATVGTAITAAVSSVKTTVVKGI